MRPPPPPEVRGLPVMTASAVATSGMSQAAIDQSVRTLAHAGESTYSIDRGLFADLEPDLIITQALCDVCAVSEGLVHRVRCTNKSWAVASSR